MKKALIIFFLVFSPLLLIAQDNNYSVFLYPHRPIAHIFALKSKI